LSVFNTIGLPSVMRVARYTRVRALVWRVSFMLYWAESLIDDLF
jgi:hypothetical protein